MADFKGKSLKELRALREEIDGLIKDYEDTRRKELLAELEELGGIPTASKPPRIRGVTDGSKDGRASPKPTHRDPATGQTWASRGVRPKWLQAYVDEGKNPDDYRIKE